MLGSEAEPRPTQVSQMATISGNAGAVGTASSVAASAPAPRPAIRHGVRAYGIGDGDRGESQGAECEADRYGERDCDRRVDDALGSRNVELSGSALPERELTPS